MKRKIHAFWKLINTTFFCWPYTISFVCVVICFNKCILLLFLAFHLVAYILLWLQSNLILFYFYIFTSNCPLLEAKWKNNFSIWVRKRNRSAKGNNFYNKQQIRVWACVQQWVLERVAQEQIQNWYQTIESKEQFSHCNGRYTSSRLQG